MECAVDLFACEMEDETVRSHVRERLWLAASPIDRSREKEAFLTTVLLDARNVAVRYGRTRVTRQWDTVTHTRSHASGRYSRTVTPDFWRDYTEPEPTRWPRPRRGEGEAA